MDDKKKKFGSVAREVRCDFCNHILWKDRGIELEIKTGTRVIRLNRELPGLGTLECCGFVRKLA